MRPDLHELVEEAGNYAVKRWQSCNRRKGYIPIPLNPVGFDSLPQQLDCVSRQPDGKGLLG
jgi:hypothetical protein